MIGWLTTEIQMPRWWIIIAAFVFVEDIIASVVHYL